MVEIVVMNRRCNWWLFVDDGLMRWISFMNGQVMIDGYWLLIHWSPNCMSYCLRCGLINWNVNLWSCMMMVLNNWLFLITGGVVNRFFMVDIMVWINSISVMVMMRLMLMFFVVMRLGVMLMMM